MKDKINIKEYIKTIPNLSGIYQYFDESGNLLYVGKAKDLHKRVHSYFATNKQHDIKTLSLIKQIKDIKFTIVNSDTDAWLLENTLIKQYKPKYNFLLRDDSTYPYIVIKNERFPRIFVTRKVIKDGSKYFGPYPSATNLRTVLDLIKKLFPIRTCSLKLSADNINKNKFKACLEYQIKNCKAPCQGLQTHDEYDDTINNIVDILKGNYVYVLKKLKTQINYASKQLNFEKAHDLNLSYLALKQFQAKSTVVSTTIDDADVFSIVSREKYANVNYLKIKNGAIINSQNMSIKKKLNETDQEILSFCIYDFIQKFNIKPKEIIVPIPIDVDLSTKISIPKLGDKKLLLDLSKKNALISGRNSLIFANNETISLEILEKLREDLHLKNLPLHIECFDNSNIMGTYPVSAMVVFKNAKPSKKDYRLFNIKTVEGPDDFATMREVFMRRYKDFINKDDGLPDLIVVDGGKGQLSSAIKVLKDIGLYTKVPIISLAKKLEEIYFPQDKDPLILPRSSISLKILQYLRDEAHRFGLKHHRNRRSKGAINSQLTNIPTIGKITMEKLLKQFLSINYIIKAKDEELLKIVNKRQLSSIRQWSKDKDIS
ncbi:MAG: excinuclease ABC subunit UvrC [Solitalea-like symbiont of Acarus siro]